MFLIYAEYSNTMREDNYENLEEVKFVTKQMWKSMNILRGVIPAEHYHVYLFLLSAYYDGIISKRHIDFTNNLYDYINHSVEGKEIIPDNFFLVPKFIIKNNKKLKISSGFDAISQAMESLILQMFGDSNGTFKDTSVLMKLAQIISDKLCGDIANVHTSTNMMICLFNLQRLLVNVDVTVVESTRYVFISSF